MAALSLSVYVAHAQLGILYRNFYSFTVIEIVCIYYIVPLLELEYACAVWDPYLNKNIKALEDVQKFALRYV